MNVIGGLTGKVVVNCEYCDDASARCIDETGAVCCSLCPIKKGLDSIRFTDMPALLKWCREVLDGGSMGGSSFEALRTIVGHHPLKGVTRSDKA